MKDIDRQLATLALEEAVAQITKARALIGASIKNLNDELINSAEWSNGQRAYHLTMISNEVKNMARLDDAAKTIIKIID